MGSPCGACAWLCVTAADCPGGTLDVDGGVPDAGLPGVCHECKAVPAGAGTLDVCKPLDAPDPSCTLGLAGFPCDTGGACETGSSCISITDTPTWTTGYCAPDCEP